MKTSSEPINYSTLSEDDAHQALLDRDRHFNEILASPVKQTWNPDALPPIPVLLLPGRVVNMDQILSRFP